MTEYYKELFEDYLKEVALRGHRERGVLVYKAGAPRIIEYLEDNDLKPNQVKYKEATEFQGYLIKQGKRDGTGYSNRSVKSLITCAHSFFNYLKRKGIVLSNPFTEIKRLPDEECIPRNILKEKELNDVLTKLRKIDEFEYIHKRISRYKAHVVSELMYATGLRISEVADLKTNDIDLIKGIVYVREGKRGEPRVAYLNEYSKEVLRIYIDKMKEIVLSYKNKKQTLFGVRWHSLMTMVSAELGTICKELNLPKQTSHNLRHSLGTHLLRAGCDIRYVQEILGHKRLQNTQVYTKVDKEDLKRVLDSCHPRRFNHSKLCSPTSVDECDDSLLGSGVCKGGGGRR